MGLGMGMVVVRSYAEEARRFGREGLVRDRVGWVEGVKVGDCWGFK